MICEMCGYKPRVGDAHYIEEHKVTWVRCYQCGHEWVE